MAAIQGEQSVQIEGTKIPKCPNPKCRALIIWIGEDKDQDHCVHCNTNLATGRSRDH